MKPLTGQRVVPRSAIGAYHTRTSLQSFSGETSTARTSFSICPRRPLIGDQLAWRSSTVRESIIRLTAATWPSSMPP
jgi:hypothetical protein